MSDDTPSPTPTLLLDAYAPKREPFAHQRELFELSARKRAFAYFMEPGTGKTKVALDTACFLFERGVIKGLLVAAPNDVHAQWVEEQVPEHVPDRIDVRALVWEGSRAAVMQRLHAALMRTRPTSLALLAMNHEALATVKGKKAALKFLKTFPSLFILDESHAFKTPKAARTRAALALAPLAVARRILTGTETDGNPFDLYSQFQFLDPRIIGFDSFVAFKHRYGIFQKKTAMTRPTQPGKKPRIVEFETLQEYARLDELTTRIAPFIYRRRLRDCVDLPALHRARLPTHLSPAQRDVYEALLDEGLVLLEQSEQRGAPIGVRRMDALTDEELVAAMEAEGDGDDRMTLRLKLTLNLRLQQCAGGFVTDDAGRTTMIDGTWDKCPRMVAVVDALSGVERGAGKVIVWAMFRAELEALERAVREVIGAASVVRIDGSVVGEERAERIAAFKSPDAHSPTILLAHPRTMGTGQNLPIASRMYFYSNPLSSILRTQSENRIVRIGQTRVTTIYDVVARDAPIDRTIIDALASKSTMSARLAHMDATALRAALALRDA